MLPEWTVVGFTGHRTITDPKAIAASICAALDSLAAKNPRLVAISSLAEGSDILFIEEVGRRKIPYLIVFPFPTARFQQDFNPGDWKRVTSLVAQSSHLEEVTGSKCDNEAYMETGIRIVDRSDVVIVVWDGKPSAGFGGTGDVVTYSRALGKPLRWINADTGAVLDERFGALPDVNASGDWSGDAHQVVEQHFHELDRAASLRAPTVRHLLQRIVLLHLTASAAGLMVLTLDIQGLAADAIVLLEIGVLGVALVLGTRRHQRHVKWIKTRIQAEICRSFLATWPMRERIVRFPELSLRGFERFIRNLQVIQQLDRRPEPPLQTACDEYLRDRIQAQIDYFSRQGAEAHRSYRRLKTLALASTVAAAVLAASHFALSLIGFEGLMLRVTNLLSLLLPLVSAAIFSLILTQEYSRRSSRYEEMRLILEDAAQQLRAVRTGVG